MRFKDAFSIIGPSMVGPSSSHTAGAVRIGRAARQLFGTIPEVAELVLFKSFAETYRGHGTDAALAAGLLDLDTDDSRIRDALALAEAAGLKLTFRKGESVSAHPNTAEVIMHGMQHTDRITGCSIGGGNIEITAINGFDVSATMQYPTLVLFHEDRPRLLAEVTQLLGGAGINIGYMDVDRKGRGGPALTVIETDEPVSAELRSAISGLSTVQRVALIDLTAK